MKFDQEDRYFIKLQFLPREETKLDKNVLEKTECAVLLSQFSFDQLLDFQMAYTIFDRDEDNLILFSDFDKDSSFAYVEHGQIESVATVRIRNKTPIIFYSGNVEYRNMAVLTIMASRALKKKQYPGLVLCVNRESVADTLKKIYGNRVELLSHVENFKEELWKQIM